MVKLADGLVCSWAVFVLSFIKFKKEMSLL
jgi:hypothetical protein